MAHPRRRALHQAVLRDPGLPLCDAARMLGLSRSATLHHATVLERAGLVRRQRRGRATHLFAADRPEGWQAAVLLRRPELWLLREWIEHNPGATQVDIVREWARHGWSRSTTQHRLASLVRGGPVAAVRSGRNVTHWAVEPPTVEPTPIPASGSPHLLAGAPTA